VTALTETTNSRGFGQAVWLDLDSSDEHKIPRFADAGLEVIGTGQVACAESALTELVSENTRRLGGIVIWNPDSQPVYISPGTSTMGLNGWRLVTNGTRTIRTTSKISIWVGAGFGSMTVSYMELGV